MRPCHPERQFGFTGVGMVTFFPLSPFISFLMISYLYQSQGASCLYRLQNKLVFCNNLGYNFMGSLVFIHFPHLMGFSCYSHSKKFIIWLNLVSLNVWSVRLFAVVLTWCVFVWPHLDYNGATSSWMTFSAFLWNESVQCFSNFFSIQETWIQPEVIFKL